MFCVGVGAGVGVGVGGGVGGVVWDSLHGKRFAIAMHGQCLSFLLASRHQMLAETTAQPQLLRSAPIRSIANAQAREAATADTAYMAASILRSSRDDCSFEHFPRKGLSKNGFCFTRAALKSQRTKEQTRRVLVNPRNFSNEWRAHKKTKAKTSNAESTC